MESTSLSVARRIAEALNPAEGESRLDALALLVAETEYPGLDHEIYLGKLDALAAHVRLNAAEGDQPRPLGLISAINRCLFEEEGFEGNFDDYYDPRNSFLNDVIDRKMGIPISLSAVYIEVGRRTGLLLEGVGFPGHFLVKAKDEEGEIVADPFHAGKLLSAQDCQKRLDRVYGGKVKLEASMLEAVGPRQMLLRMLRNLKAIYVRGEDYLRALRVLELLLLLDAENGEDLRDRGLVYAALDCYAAAAADLEAYLQLQPRALEADKIVLKIADMKRRAARLN